MDLGISGRKAIVCGSSRGLGRACAISLARAGCTVIVTRVTWFSADSALSGHCASRVQVQILMTIFEFDAIPYKEAEQ